MYIYIYITYNTFTHTNNGFVAHYFSNVQIQNHELPTTNSKKGGDENHALLLFLLRTPVPAKTCLFPLSIKNRHVSDSSLPLFIFSSCAVRSGRYVRDASGGVGHLAAHGCFYPVAALVALTHEQEENCPTVQQSNMCMGVEKLYASMSMDHLFLIDMHIIYIHTYLSYSIL